SQPGRHAPTERRSRRESDPGETGGQHGSSEGNRASAGRGSVRGRATSQPGRYAPAERGSPGRRVEGPSRGGGALDSGGGREHRRREGTPGGGRQAARRTARSGPAGVRAAAGDAG